MATAVTSSCRSAALRTYREKHNIVRAELARWAGIDANTLYRYETGRTAVPRYVVHLYRYYVRLYRDRLRGGKEAIE
jgi:predicted transcriptional regulator